MPRETLPRWPATCGVLNLPIFAPHYKTLLQLQPRGWACLFEVDSALPCSARYQNGSSLHANSHGGRITNEGASDSAIKCLAEMQVPIDCHVILARRITTYTMMEGLPQLRQRIMVRNMNMPQRSIGQSFWCITNAVRMFDITSIRCECIRILVKTRRPILFRQSRLLDWDTSQTWRTTICALSLHPS